MTGPDETAARPLKVLAVHRYYWPDTPPYAAMLRRIVQRWAGEGHRVDVLSAQPSYKAALSNKRMPRRDELDGARVFRLLLPNEAGRPLVRILNALRLCGAILLRAVVLRRYDVIMISTSPPVLGGVAASLAARLSGARFIYHCMDIHPEIGRISGEFRRPAVFAALSWLDRWACRRAAPVLVLSNDMKEALRRRPGGTHWDIQVLNNFSLPSEGGDLATDALPFSMDRGKFTLLFAGNIGRFQGLDALVTAMARLHDREDIELLIMGEGTERERLEAMATSVDARVRFVGHHSVAVAKRAMQCASVGFVSLVPELYQYAYPSKTITYLEQGCPVLVAVEPESRLARDIADQALGVAVPAGDVERLVAAIRDLADHPDKVVAMKRNAQDTGVGRYSESAVLPVWSELLKGKETAG